MHHFVASAARTLSFIDLSFYVWAGGVSVLDVLELLCARARGPLARALARSARASLAMALVAMA